MVFSPIIWHGVEADIQQLLEQIWMPGAHTDVGGGYSNKFLGEASLLTMIDRLKKYTNVGIDGSVVEDLQRSVANIAQAEVIIHYETKKVLGRDIFERQKRTIDKSLAKKSCQFASQIKKCLIKKEYIECRIKNM